MSSENLENLVTYNLGDGGTCTMLISGLYVPIKEAASIAGVSQITMEEWTKDRIKPIPHRKSGVKTMVRASAIAEYAQSKE